VIGNPPYIRIHRIGHKEADYLFNVYKSPTSKTDLSLLFLERGLSLVLKSGLVSFISTSQWLTTDYGRNMRRMLSDGRLHSIVDFGSLPVFQKAGTYPAIFIMSSSSAKKLKLKRIEDTSQLNLRGINDASEMSIALDKLSEEPWNLGVLDIQTIIEHRNINWKHLQTFGQAHIGVLTGMDAAFVVDKNTAKQLKLEEDLLLPYAYRGAEIKKYAKTKPKARVIYPYREGEDGNPEIIPEAELKKVYPKIYQRLSEYRDTLRERKDSRKFYARGSNWYRHLRPGSFNYIRPRKFIIKGIDTRVTIGLLENNTAFNGANCPGIILKNLQGHELFYILGILNSTLITYHLRALCPAKLGGYTRFNAKNINNSPIRSINFFNPTDKARHNQIVKLVKQMLDLNKQLTKDKAPQSRTVIQRQIETTDRQIDELVYELYDLTKEEIKIVESSTK